MRRIVLSIIFITLTVLIAIFFDQIYKIKTPETNLEQYLKQDNIDLFFIGTSRVRNGISPMYVWDKYRVISYGLGSSGQDKKISYLLTKLVLKRNKPKIIIVDTNFYNNHASKVRDLLNFVPLQYRLQYSMYLFDEPLKEINVFDNYHSRWKIINKNDFTSHNYFKGLGEYEHIVYRNPVKDQKTNTKASISQDTVKIMESMQQLANETSAKIIFIKLPNAMDNIANDEAIGKLCEKYGFLYIDYNKLQNEIGLDYNTDFIDKSHINIYGGQKVLDHLIPYLIKNYQLPTHYDDKEYLSWDNDYKQYAREINGKELRFIKSFSNWYNKALYDNYTILISSNGDDVLNRLPQDIKDKFKSLGLNKFETDKKNYKYVAIIDDGKVFFEEISAKKVEYSGRMKNVVNLEVSSENKKSIINVSGKERSKNKYGLNFVIYDKVNREIVDSIWIEPNKPDVVRR